jgi:hypothetical protein
MQVLLGEILSLMKLSKRGRLSRDGQRDKFAFFQPERERKKAVVFFLATETQLSPLLKLG